MNLSVASSAQLCKDYFCFYFQNQSISAFSDAPIINWAEYARNKDSHDNSRESEGGNSAIIFFVYSVRKAGLAKRCATFYGTLVSALFSVALFEPRPGPYLKCFVIVFAGIFVLSSLSDEKVIFFSFLFPLIFQEIIFFSELCWGKAMAVYTKSQQRKKEESERLRGERERSDQAY